MSLNSPIPAELRYNQIEPPAIRSYVESFRWDPIGAQNTGVSLGNPSGTQLKFQMEWDEGFVNNYETMIFVDIDFSNSLSGAITPDNLPVPNARVNCLQLDSSIHSIFSWTQLKSRSAVIEFIENYDVLAAVLSIMNYSPNDRLQRSGEGYGGLLNPTGGNQFTRSSAPFVKGTQGFGASNTTNYYHTYFQPAAQNGYYYCAGDLDPLGQQIIDSFLAEGDLNGGILVGADQGMVTRNLLSKQYVYGFQTKYMQNDFDTSRNVVTNANFGGQVYSFPKCYGFEAPFVEAFSCTCFETAFCTNSYQNSIRNGIPGKYYLTAQTFAFPSISAYFGVGMPRQKFKLNPLKAWGLLSWTFKLNPYLVFSNNANQLRGYDVTRMQIYMDVIKFTDQTIESSVSLSLTSGIVIPSCMWAYFSSEDVGANQYPSPTWTIYCNVTSLRIFLMLFMPSDYKKSPHVRRMKFISQNMTQWYLTINGMSYPQEPLEGNAGTNFGTPNNLEFVVETLRAWHKLFKCDNNMSFYATNAASNYVDWDPTLNPDPSTVLQDPSNIIDCTTNFNTSWDINYYFEQTGLPRCIYSIGFENLKATYKYQGGLSTGPANQIIVKRQFNAPGATAFPRKSEVLYFGYFDCMVKLQVKSTELVGYTAVP